VLGRKRFVKSRWIGIVDCEFAYAFREERSFYLSPLLKKGDCKGYKISRAHGRIREYTTPEDLPSSATYSQIRENTYYSKDKATCYWPHIKNKKHQVTPQAVCPLLLVLLLAISKPLGCRRS
jgi:hypothetical protein